MAAPGRYTARIRYDKDSVDVPFVIRADPNFKLTEADYDAQVGFLLQVRDKYNAVQKAILQVRSIREQLQALNGRLDSSAATVRKLSDSIVHQLTSVEESLYQTKSKSGEDMLNFPIRVNDKLSGLYGIAAGGNAVPSKQAKEVFAELSAKADVQLDRLRAIIRDQLSALNKMIYERQVPVISTKVEEEGGQLMESDWLDLSSTLGLIATAVLSFNILLGILLSTGYRRSPLWKRMPVLVKKISVDDLHNWTAYVALVLAAAHPVVLLADKSLKYRVSDIVLPVSAPHQPLWTMMGALALYAVIVVIITTQKLVKRRLGFRVWKNIHLISYGTALLFVIHGIFMDPELKDRPVDWLDGEKLVSEICAVVLVAATIVRWRHYRYRQ